MSQQSSDFLSIFLFRNLSFLREVAKESKTNNMDASNLATVFGPTIFRSSMDDPIKAVMELKVSHTILYNIILREMILQRATRLFKEHYRQKLGSTDRMLTDNPVLSSQKLEMSIDLGDLNSLDPHQKSEIVDITSSISPAMISRMTRGGGGRESHQVASGSNNYSNHASHGDHSRGLSFEEIEEEDEESRLSGSQYDRKREESIEELGSNREPPLFTANDIIDIGVEIVDEDALLKSDSQEGGRKGTDVDLSRKDPNIFDEANEF